MIARVAIAVVIAGMPVRADADKGLHVGAGVMGIDADEVDVPFKPGLRLGAYITTPFNAIVSFQPGVLLSHQRAVHVSCPQTMADCVDDGDITLWYLEVPLLLRFDLLGERRTRFHLDAGLEAVLTLGGGQTDRATDMTEVFTDLTPGNAGVMLGAGVEFVTGPGRVTLDVRYKHWFLPIATGGDASMNQDDEVSPDHGVMAMVGYAFP